MASTGSVQPHFPDAGGVLVGADVAGVDADGPLHRADRVVFDLHFPQQPLPGAVGCPLAQPLVSGLPRPVALGQIPPRHAGTGLPQNRVDHLPVIAPPPTALPHRWQQRLDPRPRRIGQPTASHHEPMLTHSRDPQDTSWTNTVPGAYEARVNQSTGRRPRLASKAWTCSALRQQPRGQSNSTGRPSNQPTAAAR